MKRICILSAMSLVLLLFSGTMAAVFAQSKPDAVIMLDGERKEVKIVGVQANTVKFKYTGENLEYELPKEKISQIQFATGRVEVMNAAPQPSRSASNSADRKNKIAVLPFQFVTNDGGFESSQMAKQLQADCASSFRKKTSNIIIQDPLTTNRLLAQNNIDMNDAATVDPKELAVVLGVEYVVFGTVNVMNKGTLTSGGATTTYKDKENRNRDKNDRETKASGQVITANSGVTSTNYDTKVALNIYTDQGNSYYSKSKNSFGNQTDSYSSSLDYLIKRTPFGSKGQ